MQKFDPDRPARVHDAFNEMTFTWRTGWSENWRRTAFVASDRLAFRDGLILDGWDPLQLSAP